MFQEVYVVDDGEELIFRLREVFNKQSKIRFKNVKTKDIEDELKNIPELIIVNADNVEINIEDLCQTIRSDEDNSITPVIVVTSDMDEENQVSILKKSVEYVIEKSIGNDKLYHIINNLMRLLYVNRRVSPLTGLPGNVQIHAELKKRLFMKKEFEVLYLDLDNFKAYNDIYGFLKGDEIIKLAARIITENVHMDESADVFVGHIGGDDFVAIVDAGVDYEKICQNVIADFDNQVLAYFNEEDKERGYLEISNRKGVLEQFILTSISIGVVVVDRKHFHNILEIGEIGAQVKHVAKSIMGSSYAVDRRA